MEKSSIEAVLAFVAMAGATALEDVLSGGLGAVDDILSILTGAETT